MSDPVAMVIAAVAAPTAANIGVLVTGLLLGIRHGIDWDHIAAITDITSTTAATGMADAAHAGQHREECPSLWRPAQAPLVERLTDRRPVAAGDPGPAK